MLTLPQALRLVGKPSFCKTAGELATVDASNNNYGSREATFISYVDAIVKNASAEELQEIRDHARLWEIEEDCKLAHEKIVSATKVASLEDADYALSLSYKGKTVRKYAAFDDESTQHAAVSFYENRARYPFAVRAKTAAVLLGRADKYDAKLPDYVSEYLHKAAGIGVPTSEALSDAVIARERFITDSEEMGKLAEVVEMLQEDPACRFNFAIVKQAVQIMDDLDAKYGLRDCGVPLPEEIIGATEPTLSKIAAELGATVRLTNGKEVNTVELTKEALAAVDPDLANKSQSELMDILPTLPRPDADLLVRLV